MTSLRPPTCAFKTKQFPLFYIRTPSVSIPLLSSLTISIMLAFWLLFFVSVYIPIGACVLAVSGPVYRNPSLADKLTTRQAAGSVPASQFVRRAFQGCKCWCNLRSIHLTVTYCPTAIVVGNWLYIDGGEISYNSGGLKYQYCKR